ncbi:unnamed protein product [Symbiodinium microadriaticum]|nr:unnamed protein product [Symbiodinium microadriaticum]
MDWSHLVSLLPSEPAAKIGRLGLSDVVDVAFYWRSLDEALIDLAPQDDDEACACEMFYRRCRQASQREQGLRAGEITLDRQSMFAKRPSSAPSDSAGGRSAKAPRLLWSTLPAGSAVGIPTLTSPKSSAKPIDEVRSRNVAEFFSTLRTSVLDLRQLGFDRVNWDDLNQAGQARAMIMKATEHLSLSRLNTLHRCLRRWLQYSTSHGIPAFNPAPAHFAAFLQGVSEGGPTAACSVYQALRWIVLNMGACLPTEHVLIRPFRLHSPGHVSRQAEELQPWEFLNILELTRDLQGSPRVLACLVIMSAVSCIRFAHLQRSTFVRATPDFLEFLCRKGKSRRQGSRQPYSWAMPQVVWGDLDVTAILRDFFTSSLPSSAGFLLPALALQCEDLWQIHDLTAFRIDRKMSRSRFLELFRGLLIRAGLPFEKASRAGYNRLRRFLPTGAKVCALSPHEAQAVGSWVELPEGALSSGSSASRPQKLMSDHYAGEKVSSSAAIKLRILRAVFRTVQAKRIQLVMTDRLLQPGCILWEHIQPSAALPSSPQGGASAPKLPDSGSSGSQSDDGSSDTSVASSCCSSNQLVNEGDADEIEWFSQRARRHVVREVVDGRLVPWCREEAFRQDPVAKGVGLSQRGSPFCHKCLARMPEALRRRTGALSSSKDLAIFRERVQGLRRCAVAAIVLELAMAMLVITDDQGLQACFKRARLESSWVEEFCKTLKIETLEDYIYLFNKSTWESEIETHLQSIPALKDNRLALSRFKAAYEAGAAAIKNARDVASKIDADKDLDEPLGEVQMSQLMADWKKSYDLEMDPQLEPADTLRGRVFREFKRKSMTVLEMRKVKTVVSACVPSTTEVAMLSDSLALQLKREQISPIKDVVQYYWRLRTLCYCWAFCGNWMMVDHDGVSRKMMTLTDALAYADNALREAMTYGAGSLSWLERVDTLTRGRMASLVRRGWSASQALKEARRESYLDWRSPASSDPQGEAGPVRRRPDGVPEPPAKVARPLVRTVSMLKGGRKLCKPWNDDRGCSGNCGNAHLCDVRLESGEGSPAPPGEPPRSVTLEAVASTSSSASSTPVTNRAPALEDVDRVALDLLAKEDFSEQACLQILRGCFAKPTSNRRLAVLGQAGLVNYHILGFFASQTGIGLTDGTKHFPAVCKYINVWLRQFFPQDSWCSIAVSFNLLTKVHADMSNDLAIPNKCIALGPHQGGRLWLEDPRGKVEYRDSGGQIHLGRQVDIRMKPCTFQPRQLHGSILDPFQGERWVLVAYVPEAFRRCEPAIHCQLRDLLFPVSDIGLCRMVQFSKADEDRSEVRTVQMEGASDVRAPDTLDYRDRRSLSELLVAARPVVWRGAGDLLQVPWAKGPPGRWLILDLFAGYSGLCIAALSAGLHFWALAAETDEGARKVASAVMPSIVHVSDVVDVEVDALLPFIRRRRPRGIIIGAGTPCQPHSVLNRRRRGMDDPRARAPEQVRDLAAALRGHPECDQLEVLVLLENVASMDVVACAQYSEWMSSQPVVIQAADCGWTARHRIYWLSGRTRTLSPTTCQAPSDWTWASDDRGRAQLKYCGQKPVPSRVHFEGGFQLLQDPAMVMKGEAEPVFTFTREFFHPDDSTQGVPAQAVRRFRQDSQRFPPAAYNETSLVWRGDEWRQLSPSERSQMLGVPPSATAAVTGNQDERCRVRNSLLGNGFHLPSILVLISVLAQLCDAKISFMPDPQQEALRARTANTVWGGDWLYNAPGLLSVDDVVHDMEMQLEQLSVPPLIWQECRTSLSHCDIVLPQAFSCFQRSRGKDWDQCPPRPILARDRTQIFASNSGQRYSSEESRGLDFLLPPGLGKYGHVVASAQLQIAYHFLLLANAIVLNASLGLLLRFVNGCVGHDATVLSAISFVHGFAIVGEIPRTGIFREIVPKEAEDIQTWLGDDAAHRVDEIMSKGPPRFSDEIWAVTQQEIDKGFCSQPLTRSHVDKLFGRGGWRPLERFLIIQPDGKQRVIDNAKRTGHNDHVQMLETIFTVSVDFIACAIRDVLNLISVDGDGLPPQVDDWLDVRVGTDDLPDAYRGHPVLQSQLKFSIVAVYVPNAGWRFIILWGLAYGLEAAVVAFNRFSTFGVSIARRCASSMAAAYFDDELSVEFVHGSCVSQTGLKLVFKLLGAPPQPVKSFPPAADRHYLGASVHVGDVFAHREICVQPKFLTVQKVLSKLDQIINAGRLDRDGAGKLRGDLMWLFSSCSGFAGKYAGPLLARYQHGDDPSLDDEAQLVLSSLKDLVLAAGPRKISVLGNPPSPLCIYTDASFENGELRLGWIILRDRVCLAAGTSVVPPSVLDAWKPRSQQIFPGEALCVLVVPALHPQLLFQEDAVWFVDNQAALVAAIKGGCRETDVHAIAYAAATLRTRLSFRCWFEWVDSDSNPSDGLSRVGLQCEFIASQGWSAEEFVLPDLFANPADVLSSMASRLNAETVGD